MLELEQHYFTSARPVWPAGMDQEMNLTVGFRACFDSSRLKHVRLRVATASIYRVFINGIFVGHGPARGPKGYFRVDEWDLSGKLAEGLNIIAVEVASYNVANNYLMVQSPFLQAEAVCEGKVIVSTDGDGALFQAQICRERIQKVMRYSIQRDFSEYYRLKLGFDLWRKAWDVDFIEVPCNVLEERNLIPRRVKYPEFSLRSPVKEVVPRPLFDGQLKRMVY